MPRNPNIALGRPELDEQHRDVFARLDLLIHAIRRGDSRDEVARTLAFLRRHVSVHFAAEEALMAAVAFPGLTAHRAEHDRFERDLADLEADHGRNGATPRLILAVSRRISAWLDEHLSRSDRALAEFVRRR